MKKLILIFCISFFFSCNQDKKDYDSAVTNSTPISNESLDRVEPPYWWTGMKNTNLQLLIHHENIGDYKPSIVYEGVTLKKTHQAKSPNYLFLDIALEKASEGKFDIVFKNSKGVELKHTYELKSREKEAKDYLGFNSTDAILLITPDRFSNANPNNDIIEGLNETAIDRTDNYARHGGDIQGITEHLDYISNLGYTAIWPSPLLINDMHRGSYHGYAITDYYKVDPRFGTFAEYRNLADKAREKGMKLIMDQVANHCGLEHWWMKDLPFKDWVNDQENFEKNITADTWNWQTYNGSNHRRTTNQDIYASKVDKEGNANGWFVAEMPDLNQRNPFMATYIIQNSIWWIEALGLGGIRQDTYPYPDKDFMSDWAGAIMTEYPNFNIVGEEWSYNPLLIAYWQDGHNNKDGYNSNLKSTMDFAMQRLVINALNEKEQWDTGLVKIYEGLANDFNYTSPKDILVFPDNHDMSRVFTQLKGDVVNTKIALGYYSVIPRTLQMYYGTEILMNDFEKPGDHGLVRTDFPGGWPGDGVNAFTGEGLTANQKDMQQYLKTLLNYRKTSEAIHNGKTVHFAPFLGTYFLFRVHNNETVVHIINKNNDEIEIDLKRYAEMGLEGKTLKNIITGNTITWGESITLNQRGNLILTTKL